MKLSNVGTYRGAPMGRIDTHRHNRTAPIQLIVHECPLDEGGYDEGGAYWGIGDPLWRAVSPDGGVGFFLRSKTRDDALGIVRTEYENAVILATPYRRWFEEFVQGYEEAALWVSRDDEHEGFEGMELAASTKNVMRDECSAFCVEVEQPLVRAINCKDYSAARAGHDFWLTRCGHGAGYWDRTQLPREIRDSLSNAARDAGERDLYIGDDGLVYQS